MNRIFHPWDKWECYKHNFFGSLKGLKKPEAEEMYRSLLSNPSRFEECLQEIINTWKYSCEHNLSNKDMNRVVWLGQASLALKYQIPADYRNGYNLLSVKEQETADKLAQAYLDIWEVRNKDLLWD